MEAIQSSLVEKRIKLPTEDREQKTSEKSKINIGYTPLQGSLYVIIILTQVRFLLPTIGIQQNKYLINIVAVMILEQWQCQ